MNKKLVPSTFITLLLVMLLNNACMEESVVDTMKTHITFKVFSKNEELKNISSESFLVINFQNLRNQEIINHENIQFEYTENGFITTSLEVPDKNYRIIDCFIVNHKNEILYAAPKPNSKLSTSSSSQGMGIDNSSIKLLDVDNYFPRDFGYTSFMNPNHVLRFTVTLPGSPKAVAAYAYLLNAADTLGEYRVRASQNTIHIPQGSTANLKLVIVKKGCLDYSYTFTSTEVKHNYGKPLKFILTPAFKMLGVGSPSFEFDLGAPDGTSVFVNWGDGIQDSYTIGRFNDFLSHLYTIESLYPVNVTGDLDKITYFYSFYGLAMIDDIDLTALTALNEIRFGLTRSPSVLDLSHNSKLEFLMIPNLDNLRELILPRDHRIKWLMMEGPNEMTTTTVDAVVNNLYNNIVRNKVTNGWLSIEADWTQQEEDKSIIGPPSAVALAQLKIMKEKYGWTIYPDPTETNTTVTYLTKVHQNHTIIQDKLLKAEQVKMKVLQ